MELDTIRAFLAVADGSTVTETAEQLHRTQPAVSRALARLEREVGTPLLQRVGRGLTLTPAGRELAGHARDTLDAYERGMRSVQDITAPDGGFVPLAFLHTLGTWLVPELIRGFRAERPNVRFDLRQHGDAGLIDDLLNGVVDLAITGDRPQLKQLESRQLFQEPLRLVVPPDHRLASRRTARLGDVAHEEFIVLKRGFSLRSVTEDLCAQVGFTPQIGFEGEEVETLRGLVSAGLGVALLPESRSGAAPIAPSLRITDVRASREIGLAWVRDRHLPPASAQFRDHALRTSSKIHVSDA
ncbi:MULTISPECIES: LysR substrate-binding domain-containing protein [unclassified Nocardioides]|uniref:LysR substrate-binding domain-containing protein n=1 Tax=unclassified Nocardioides TaxID=2615069 RepID=UPI0006F63DB3|nr:MULTISPECIES: LysR substrate-binding domain-containing protein [unclassified Nocardioides]KQY56778.1 LysR family transcriptional regulator [Nocardioides sp. Root140]KRF12898.1 LysR family transcriptional regulator [Nocardioides sp. Soil796]